MIRILVSSCLLGNAVRHNGKDARIEDAILSKWKQEGRVVAFCPELAGGFAVPRPAAEIVSGDGLAVWEGKAEVKENTGRNVTRLFVKGAKEALEKAKELNVQLAVLTDGSPSCGTSYIHDGTFEGGTRPGFGVTAALLERNGIAVFGEKQLSEAAEFLLRVQSRR